MRVLSGIQPTGRFHWGNYFGAIQQYIALQNNEQSCYLKAPKNPQNTVRDRKQLEDNVWDAAVDLLALGLNPDQASLFRQSDVPEVTELMWVLMTVTQFSLLEKCHSYKDKVAKGIAADAGLFTYPVLMAADILLYDSDIVPVGADQIQHLEVTRDIAQRFNSIFGGEYLHLPNARVLEEGAKVPGTDGEKMSKSYGNTLEIFEAEKPLRKKIMSIKTDSTPMEAPKNPDTCSIYTLYKLFSTPEQQATLATRYRAGGMGYGEAKQALYEAAMSYFAEARAKRAELAANPAYVEEVLQAGAKKARAKGQQVLKRVQEACGLKGRRA